MPSDLMLKSMNAVHRTIMKVTGGRLGWDAGKMPVLELTTIGRKSGQRHSVMLTSPVQEGSALVIVASRGGDDHHPAWFLNLLDHPAVEVSLKGQPRRSMTARVATGEERAHLWPKVIADHRNYAGYQSKTKREIPLVLLDPAAQ
jgi:deazaflavin-dependent oxidoreductase (nitroreductase family)